MAHAHTLFSSDGELSPQELADLARGRGFAAVLVADHFESLTAQRFAELRQLCAGVTGCLVAPGYERSWSGYHVLALGVDRWVDDGDIGAWATQVRDAGGITVLAHPSRYRHRVPDGVLAACDAVEVWNSKFGDASVGSAVRHRPGDHRLREAWGIRDGKRVVAVRQAVVRSASVGTRSVPSRTADRRRLGDPDASAYAHGAAPESLTRCVKVLGATQPGARLRS